MRWILSNCAPACALFSGPFSIPLNVLLHWATYSPSTVAWYSLFRLRHFRKYFELSGISGSRRPLVVAATAMWFLVFTISENAIDGEPSGRCPDGSYPSDSGEGRKTPSNLSTYLQRTSFSEPILGMPFSPRSMSVGLSRFENQRRRKSDFCSSRRGVSRLKVADLFCFGMSRRGDVLAITTSTAPIEPRFPSRSLLSSFGISGEIPGRWWRTSITDLKHSY